MRPRISAVPWVLAGAMVMMFPVRGSAADPVAARARSEVMRRAASLGIRSPVVLEAGSVYRTRNLAVTSVFAELDGVPFDGPVATVLTDAAGNVRRVVAHHGTGSAPAGLRARPVLSPGRALAVLEASGRPASRGARAAELVWMVDGGVRRLAYRIDPPADPGTLANFVYGVDAVTGEVFVRGRKDFAAQVRAFEENPVVTPNAATFTLFDVDPNAQALEGPYFTAYNCLPPQSPGECVLTPTAMPDANGDFLYPAPNVDDPNENLAPTDTFAEVSMYYHADKFHQHMTSLGFSGFLCNQNGQAVSLVANYATYGAGGVHEPFENAFWSGDCAMTMVFGQTSGADLAYDGDVVYHEFGHGVVEAETPDLTLYAPRPRKDARVGDAMALNETFADFLSSSFTNDPLVGEYAGEYWLGIDAVRNNDNEFRCPRDITGQPHNDSEPFAGALWRTYVEVGPGLIEAVLVTLRMLPNDATFEQTAVILTDVLTMLEGQAAGDILRANLDARNLFECARLLPWTDLRGFMFVQHKSIFSDAPPVQLYLDTAPDTTAIRISYFTWAASDGGDTAPVLYARFGAPMQFADEFAATEVYDLRVTLPGDGDYVIEDVPAGSRVYFGFGNEGADDMFVDLSGLVEIGGGGTSTGTSTGTGTGTTGTGTGTTGTATGTGTGTTTTAGETLSGGTTGATTEATSGLGADEIDVFADRGCVCGVRNGRHGVPVPWWLSLLLPVLRRRRRRAA